MAANQKEGERKEQPALFISGINGSQGFFSLRDAFPFIKEGGSDLQHVSIRLEIERLSVMVDGPFISNGQQSNNQMVILETPEKKGVVPRSDFDVSANPDSPIFPAPCQSINVKIGDYYNDPDIHRGLAWVIVSDPDNPALKFSLKPNEYTDEKLQQIFTRVTDRVMEVLTDGLASKIPLPLQQH